MEPVATWTPEKVATWLRGGWGRGRVGLEGNWDGERKRTRDLPSLTVVSQPTSKLERLPGTWYINRDRTAEMTPGADDPEGVSHRPIIPKGCQAGEEVIV